MSKISKGFTLIELMIVVAILGIIAAFAIPSYQRSIERTKRADATAALIGFASALERRFTENNHYCDNGGTVNDVSDCGVVGTTDIGSPTIYSQTIPLDSAVADANYNLEIAAVTRTTFVIRAVRTGSMAADECGDYTYTNVGLKDVINTSNGKDKADCW